MAHAILWLGAWSERRLKEVVHEIDTVFCILFKNFLWMTLFLSDTYSNPMLVIIRLQMHERIAAKAQCLCPDKPIGREGKFCR